MKLGGLNMEPIIREAKPEDKPFIEEIARLTWGGEDYLARVFDEWLGDNFYVLEVDGRVIGTAKLTLLPGLKRLGLHLWDETEEPNVLIFRKEMT